VTVNHSIKKESAEAGEQIASPVPALVRALGSAKSAVFIAVALVAACILGTLLPQGTAATAYFQGLPNASRWINAAAMLGFTHAFSSWWFIGLLFILASGVAACSACRLVAARRTSGLEVRRCFASALTHASLLLIFSGALVRVLWGETGSITLREGELTTTFTVRDGKRTLPFAMRLEKTRVETEPALKPLAANVPSIGAAVKNVRSEILLGAAGNETRTSIAVNEPLTLAGYRIYQLTSATDYSGRATLQVVRDPGVSLVYAGFIALLGGLAVTLYINPWLSRRALASSSPQFPEQPELCGPNGHNSQNA
jgi:cytochrome c biogenesis protein ResB